VSTIPAFQSGLAGIQSGLEQISKNTATLASKDGIESTVDLTSALVSNLSAELQIKASAKVLETSIQTVGTLLDITV
jgi:hypothetical protein